MSREISNPFDMKKLLFILIAVFASISSFSQDIITLKTGDEIKSKVLEVTPDLVKYKKWENQDGPIYSSNKSEVFMIKYINGTKDVFNTSAATNSNSDQNSILNNGNKFIGTWIYPDGAYDIYRIYKITISRNGEDFLLNTESGTNDIGTTYKKAVGKLVGTSIEIDAYTKASLIGNGNKLLLGEREYIKSSVTQRSNYDGNVKETQSTKSQEKPIKKSTEIKVQNNRVPLK
jgi:hypothetical protein